MPMKTKVRKVVVYLYIFIKGFTAVLIPNEESGSDHMNPRLPAPRVHYPASTGMPFVAQIVSSAPSGTQTHAYQAELVPFSDITLSDSRMLADAIRVYSSMEDFAPLPASNKAADPSANIRRLLHVTPEHGTPEFLFPDTHTPANQTVSSNQPARASFAHILHGNSPMPVKKGGEYYSVTIDEGIYQQRLAICSSSLFSLGLYKEVVVGFVYSLPVS